VGLRKVFGGGDFLEDLSGTLSVLQDWKQLRYVRFWYQKVTRDDCAAKLSPKKKGSCHSHEKLIAPPHEQQGAAARPELSNSGKNDSLQRAIRDFY
jgi:hypothetical protein